MLPARSAPPPPPSLGASRPSLSSVTQAVLCNTARRRLGLFKGRREAVQRRQNLQPCVRGANTHAQPFHAKRSQMPVQAFPQPLWTRVAACRHHCRHGSHAVNVMTGQRGSVQTSATFGSDGNGIMLDGKTCVAPACCDRLASRLRLLPASTRRCLHFARLVEARASAPHHAAGPATGGLGWAVPCGP